MIVLIVVRFLDFATRMRLKRGLASGTLKSLKLSPVTGLATRISAKLSVVRNPRHPLS